MADEKKESKKITPKFNKEALLKCKKYKADIINAFLEDNKLYSIKEVDEIINKKMKGEM